MIEKSSFLGCNAYSKKKFMRLYLIFSFTSNVVDYEIIHTVLFQYEPSMICAPLILCIYLQTVFVSQNDI